MKHPSSEEGHPEIEGHPEVATVLSLGKVMKGWDTDSGSRLWTPEPPDVRSDLPSLRLRTRTSSHAGPHVRRGH